MSRVRIYELAKEAGMSSKALADKLVEEGYDIKGHSSTVDEDTAARIRKTVLKESDTELVEKRISGDQGSTVIRRRATVIRRRPKAVAEEEAPEADEPVDAVEADDLDAVAQDDVEEISAERAEEPVGAEPESEPEVEITAVQAKVIKKPATPEKAADIEVEE